MIESLFEEFPSKQNKKSDGESEFRKPPDDQNYSETELLAVLPVVRKIVKRKTVLAFSSDASDVIQSVALRLWKWREKYADKSEDMSREEWESFAARTAYNEINRHFSNKSLTREVQLDAALTARSDGFIEGQTDVEVDSLAKSVWQAICFLSLRQRRALLLNSQELVFHIRQSGVGDEEIARVLEISKSEWADVKMQLPLTNFQIAKFFQETAEDKSIESLNKSMNKARHKARVRLKKLLSE